MTCVRQVFYCEALSNPLVQVCLQNTTSPCQGVEAETNNAFVGIGTV